MIVSNAPGSLAAFRILKLKNVILFMFFSLSSLSGNTQEKFTSLGYEVSTGTTWTVTKNGKQLNLPYEMIIPAAEDTFIVMKNKKVGLVTGENKIVLPLLNDALFCPHSVRSLYIYRDGWFIYQSPPTTDTISMFLFSYGFENSIGIWVQNNFSVYSVSPHKEIVKPVTQVRNDSGLPNLVDGVYDKFDTSIRYKPMRIQDLNSKRLGNDRYDQVHAFGYFIVGKTEKALLNEAAKSDEPQYKTYTVYDVFDREGKLIFNDRKKDIFFVDELLGQLKLELKKADPTITDILITSYADDQDRFKYIDGFYLDFSPVMVKSLSNEKQELWNIFIPTRNRFLSESKFVVSKHLISHNFGPMVLMGNQKELIIFPYDNLIDTLFFSKGSAKVGYQNILAGYETRHYINEKEFAKLSGPVSSMIDGTVTEEISLSLSNALKKSSKDKPIFIWNEYWNARPEMSSSGDREAYKNTDYSDFKLYDGVSSAKMMYNDTLVYSSTLLNFQGQPLKNASGETVKAYKLYDAGNCLLVQQVIRKDHRFFNKYGILDKKWLKGDSIRYTNNLDLINEKLSRSKNEMWFDDEQLYGQLCGKWETASSSDTIGFNYHFLEKKSVYGSIEIKHLKTVILASNGSRELITIKDFRQLADKNTWPADLKMFGAESVFLAKNHAGQKVYVGIKKNEMAVLAKGKLYPKLTKK